MLLETSTKCAKCENNVYILRKLYKRYIVCLACQYKVDIDFLPDISPKEKRQL